MPQNKSKTSPARDDKGRLQKGASGNPGGRPRKHGEFVHRCVAVVDELVIDAWEREVRKHGPNWMEAAKQLVAYGYGKPIARHDVYVGRTLEDMLREMTDLEAPGDREMKSPNIVHNQGETPKP